MPRKLPFHSLSLSQTVHFFVGCLPVFVLLTLTSHFAVAGTCESLLKKKPSKLAIGDPILDDFVSTSESETSPDLWYFEENSTRLIGRNKKRLYGVGIDRAQRLLDKSPNEYPAIAIIDSGLAEAVARQEEINFRNPLDLIGSNDAKINDDYGHGTGIASEIASTINGKGIVGIAPGAPIIPIRIFDAKSFDGKRKSKIQNLIKAVEHAVLNGAKVINISVAATSTDWPRREVETLFSRFEDRVLFVLAAGNSGLDLDAIDLRKMPSPVGIPGKNVLHVGGVDRLGRRIETSNYGNRVEIYAPGEHILQWRLGVGDHGRGWEIHNDEKGTSHAAPIVAGVAAMILRANPGLSPIQVKEIILERSTEFQGTDKMINAASAVSAALSNQNN